MQRPTNAPFTVLSYHSEDEGKGLFEGEYYTFEKAMKVRAERAAEDCAGADIMDCNYKIVVDSLGKMVVDSIVDYDGKIILKDC
jgi:hypothetical protein